MCDGYYQSCETCNGYVTCANRNTWLRNCTSENHDHDLVWDDTKKQCESVSDTCIDNKQN